MPARLLFAVPQFGNTGDNGLEGMPQEFLTGPFRHGLTFIATLAFVVSFFGARLFAMLFPTTVVTATSSQGTIHFHHFWYGLALICAAGWMAIAWRNERLYRLYALLYGLGAGFVGDEIGLLLTLGNYEFELALLFFIAAISFVIIATLFLRYRAQLEAELVKLSFRERVFMLGVYVTGFSIFIIFLSSGINLIGIPLSLLGLGLIIFTYVGRRRKRSSSEAASPLQS